MRLTETTGGDIEVVIDPLDPPLLYELTLLVRWGTTPFWLRWWRRLTHG